MGASFSLIVTVWAVALSGHLRAAEPARSVIRIDPVWPENWIGF
jgi:hypothetical protein